MERLIVDSGVWFAVFDKTDSMFKYADAIISVLEKHQLLIPYPSLYETINTRFAKNTYYQVDKLFSYLNNPDKVILVTDDAYREDALKAIEQNSKNGKHYSLVDMIIRLMMEDNNLGPRAVFSFNVEDFAGVNAISVIDPSELKWR